VEAGLGRRLGGEGDADMRGKEGALQRASQGLPTLAQFAILEKPMSGSPAAGEGWWRISTYTSVDPECGRRLAGQTPLNDGEGRRRTGPRAQIAGGGVFFFQMRATRREDCRSRCRDREYITLRGKGAPKLEPDGMPLAGSK